MEVPLAVIEIKNVRFAQLVHHSVDDLDALGIAPADDGLTIRRRRHVQRAATANNGRDTVIGHIEIEGSITIHIGQRHGGAAEPGYESSRNCHVRESASAIV